MRAHVFVFVKLRGGALRRGGIIEAASGRIAAQIFEVTGKLARNFVAFSGGKLGIRQLARRFAAPIGP